MGWKASSTSQRPVSKQRLQEMHGSNRTLRTWMSSVSAPASDAPRRSSFKRSSVFPFARGLPEKPRPFIKLPRYPPHLRGRVARSAGWGVYLFNQRPHVHRDGLDLYGILGQRLSLERALDADVYGLLQG